MRRAGGRGSPGSSPLSNRWAKRATSRAGGTIGSPRYARVTSPPVVSTAPNQPCSRGSSESMVVEQGEDLLVECFEVDVARPAFMSIGARCVGRGALAVADHDVALRLGWLFRTARTTGVGGVLLCGGSGPRWQGRERHRPGAGGHHQDLCRPPWATMTAPGRALASRGCAPFSIDFLSIPSGSACIAAPSVLRKPTGRHLVVSAENVVPLGYNYLDEGVV